MKITAVTLVLSAVLSSLALAQTGGSLTPPVGAPTQIYKSLDQVEPRTPLVDGAPGVTTNTNGTVIISLPGSYYLTKNLNIIQFDGIIITHSDITVDLNGFTVSAENPTGNGIEIITPSLKNIEIKNGNIRGFDNSINFISVSNSRILNVHCSESRFSGSVPQIVKTSGGWLAACDSMRLN